MTHSFRVRLWAAVVAFLALIEAGAFAAGEEPAGSSETSGASKYWYDILVSTPFDSSGVREYIGASTLDEAEMARALTGSAALAITDRRVFDAKTKTWGEFARLKPLLTDRDYLNPAHVFAVYPLHGDPLAIKAEDVEKARRRTRLKVAIEPASAPGKFWYDIVASVKGPTKGVREFVGSSRLDETAFSQRLTDGAALVLDDLRFYHMDSGRWSDWASSRFPMTSRVLLNPKHVLSIGPFTGDPLVQNLALPDERTLGVCEWRDAPTRWRFQLPAGVRKVEVGFYVDGSDRVSPDPGLGGVLQINEAMAVGFRSEQTGGRTFFDYLKQAEFQANAEGPPLWLDVTPLTKPGDNEFLYYHRSEVPMGLKLRVFGADFEAVIRQLGGAVKTSQGPGETGLEVDLKDTKITDADLSCLAGQLQVTTLNLARTKIGDAGLAHLAGLRNLESLELTGVKFTGEGLRWLSGLTKLRKLRLVNTAVTDESLGHLAPLKDLRDLNLYMTQITGHGFSRLQTLQNLERLDIESPEFDDEGLQHVCGLSNLKLLFMDCPKLTDAGFACLSRAVQLEDVRIKHANLGDASMGVLKRLPKLTSLFLTDSHITDEGLRGIGAKRDLIQLGLRGAKITDAGLEHLQGLSRLRSLDLSATGVTDAGLVRLAGLTELAVLHLDGDAIQGSGLIHLSRMERLELLSLGSTQVTDAALEQLPPLSGLRRLLIYNTPVTEQGAEALRKQRPNLMVPWNRSRRQ